MDADTAQTQRSFPTSGYVFDKTNQDAKMTSHSSSFQDLEDIDFAQITSNPEGTEWDEVDLPFDMVEDQLSDSIGTQINVNQVYNTTSKSQISEKQIGNRLEVGIANKEDFFQQSLSSRNSGFPPLPYISPNKTNIPTTTSSTTTTNNNNNTTLLSTSIGKIDISMSSSNSMDTRDSMKELAKKITPVGDGNGAEFTPLDMLLNEDMHINISGSYSMSVDDAHYPPDMSYISRTSNSGGRTTYPTTTTGTASATGTTTIGNATSAEKVRLACNSTSGYDLPVESFSMSSWSQHTISADVFNSQHQQQQHQQYANKTDFSREGLLLNGRVNSDQSVTEQMLAMDWNSNVGDLNAHDNDNGGPVRTSSFHQQHQLTPQSLGLLQQHHHHQQQGMYNTNSNCTSTTNNNNNNNTSNNNSSTITNNNNNCNIPVEKNARGSRPAMLSRNAKLNLSTANGRNNAGIDEKSAVNVGSGTGNSSGVAAAGKPKQASPERSASLPIDPSPLSQQQQQQLQPQYSFPTEYLQSVGRSHSGTTNSSASTTSSYDDTSPSPSLAPVYDPNTGIVYYPHVPPGTVLPSHTQMPLPGHLLPLPTHASHSSATTAAAGSGDNSNNTRSPSLGRSPSSLERPMPTLRSVDEEGDFSELFCEESTVAGMYLLDSVSSTFSASGSGKYDRFEQGSSSNTPSTTTSPRGVIKKEKNRGSYRCGRCGKPKVNHVCAFVDAVTVSQGIQAKGHILNPTTMQPFSGDRVLTVNPTRRTIQDNNSYNMQFEAMGMTGIAPTPRNSAASQDLSPYLPGIPLQYTRSRSGDEFYNTSNISSNSSSNIYQQQQQTSQQQPLSSSQQYMPPSPGGTIRRSVSFTKPLTRPSSTELIDISGLHSNSATTTQLLQSSESDDVFFPTTYPPGTNNNNGLVFSSSRNSSVNSTYGNESDTSSTYGDTYQQRSTLSQMFSTDLGLSSFFRFG